MALQKTTTSQDVKNFIAQAAEEATTTIAHATSAAASLIANAAADAAKVVAATAAATAAANTTAIAAETANKKDDHDLLIRIETRMEGLKADIKDLKDGTTKRIETLEVEKLNIHDSYPVLYKKEVESVQSDHESRIRSNEKNIIRILTFGSALIILIGVIEFLINAYIHTH